MKQAVVVTAPEQPPSQPGFLARNRTAIFFILLLLLTDLGVGLFAPVWQKHSPDEYTARITGCAQRPRDVVVIGGSPVSEGIDPAMIAGAKWRGEPLSDAYAVGLHGGTTTDFFYATKRACPSPPRLLVYGITASDLNDSRNEPHGTHTLLSRSDLLELIRTRPDAGEWATRHYVEGKFSNASSIYRYRHGIRMWTAIQTEAIFPNGCTNATREANENRERADILANSAGYAPLEGYTRISHAHTKAAGAQSPPFNYLDRFRTGSHVKYLDKLAEWCDERGVALVLVDMPVTADLEAKYAAEFAEYRQRLAEVERARGLTVLRDTRASAELTDAHFADLIHMRPEGCRRFSTWLKSKLEEVGR